MYMRVVPLVLLAGCYDPRVLAGSPCTVDSQCPRELACIHEVCDVVAPPPIDAMIGDAHVPGDGGPTSCASFDLGSALGAVASGSTVGHTNSYSTCLGRGSPDVSYAWTAPSTGRFTIDLCSSPDRTFDSALSVHDGSCTGPQLACDDDSCDGFSLLSKLHVDVVAGQLVVIVVDGNDDEGPFTLTITRN